MNAERGLRGARASRVLVSASRRNELSKRSADTLRIAFSKILALGKSAKAGRLRQRSGRACYPEFACHAHPKTSA